MADRKKERKREGEKEKADAWFLARILNGTSTFRDKSLPGSENFPRERARLVSRKSSSCHCNKSRLIGRRRGEMSPSSGLAFYSFLRLHRGKWVYAVHPSPSRVFCDSLFAVIFYAGSPRLIEMLIQRLESLSYDKREIQTVGVSHFSPGIVMYLKNILHKIYIAIRERSD